MSEVRNSLTPARRYARFLEDVSLAVTGDLLRASLTLIAVVLGVMALVCTSALTSSSRASVVAAFDQYRASEVRMSYTDPQVRTFPEGHRERLTELSGIRAAGPVCSHGSMKVTSPGGVTFTATVYATTADGFAALAPELVDGEAFSDLHDTERLPVAIIGQALASDIQLGRLGTAPVVTVGTAKLQVSGVVRKAARLAVASTSIIVPVQFAEKHWGECKSELQYVIDADRNYVPAIAKSARPAVDPYAHDKLSVDIAPAPAVLASRVQNSATGLYYAVGGVCLLLGAVSIATTLLVAVLQRRNEIGIRRAMGYSRSYIAWYFAHQALLIGTLGGIIGTALGGLGGVLLASHWGWPFVVDGALLIGAPLVGAMTGFLGGLIPAFQASRIDPATAVRH